MAGLSRRRLLGGAAVAALAGTLDIAAAQPYKWSAGIEAPRTVAPAGAADCHHHIFDKRYPSVPGMRDVPDASIEDYRALQKRLGLTRNVIVQSSVYGTDNSLLVDSLRVFGSQARGIAVVNESVTDAELKKLHDAGVRGVRFVLIRGNATSVGMLAPLSKRINDLGWHVDIHAPAGQYVEIADELRKLPSPIVFDHLGRVPQPAGDSHPAFAVFSELLDKGRAWMKLSGAYQDSKLGPPDYSDSSKLAATYVSRWPEPVIWGTDWPHPSTANKPNGAVLFDLLAAQAPSEAARRRILVDNPAALFGFQA